MNNVCMDAENGNMNGWPQFAQINILGVRVDCVDFAETLAILEQWINEPTNKHKTNTHQICTVNPEFVMYAQRDPQFAAILNQADLCVPDGVGLLWAARRQGVRLKERVTGSDGVYRICERAAASGWRVYFLGAAPGVAAETARRLQQLYPGLLVVGHASGSPHVRDWPVILEQLNKAQPDILFVAFGHPKQDQWIAQHRAELPVHMAIGVGGAFDFVAGITKRAPRWLQRMGLEWFYRLMIQPWRIRRMMAVPHFLWRILGQSVG